MSAPGTHVVEAVGLTKIFKDFWGRPKAAAVNQIDFTISSGEVVGFLGPNGSGKSTTIKMLLGLLYPSSGSLKVFDRLPSTVNTKLRIGYLPEETYLYKYLTAAETLDFFGALFDLPPQEREKRTGQLLEMVGLGHAAHRPVGEFSKGMARRIGLAQALINDPDLVILDEPTSGLDPLGCRQVKEIIRLLAKRKKTVILCSHLLADVEDVCDNVLIMYGGRIRARGSMAELLTVEEKTRIVAPVLKPEVLAGVMALLNQFAPAGEVHVDHPSRNLEEYFLEVVRQARQESVATAGAQEEGRIAGYLSGTPDRPTGAALLESLSAKAEAQPAVTEPVAPPPPQPNQQKLASLAAPLPSAVPPPSPTAPAAPMTEADKAAASKKIEDLLKRQ